MNKSVSPSRTYVAMCSSTNFNGYYFKKFVLPEKFTESYYNWEQCEPMYHHIFLSNNTESASWYFLNKLNYEACIDGCLTWEDYCNITDQKEYE